MVLHLTRMARSPGVTEGHLPADTAPFGSAAVFPLKNCRYGDGSKHILCSTGPPTVPSKQGVSLLNSWGVALQQMKGTEMLGRVFAGFTC